MTQEYIPKRCRENREEIEDLTEKFLQKGGKVTQCPPGFRSDVRKLKPMRVGGVMFDET